MKIQNGPKLDNNLRRTEMPLTPACCSPPMISNPVDGLLSVAQPWTSFTPCLYSHLTLNDFLRLLRKVPSKLFFFTQCWGSNLGPYHISGEKLPEKDSALT